MFHMLCCISCLRAQDRLAGGRAALEAQVAELEQAADAFEAQHGPAAWYEVARTTAQRQSALEVELPSRQAELKAYRWMRVRL